MAIELAPNASAIFRTAALELTTEKHPGPLFNHFNRGGYLIWRVPRLRVSIDGRTNLHSEERIARSLSTWAGGKDWEKDPDLKAARAKDGTASKTGSLSSCRSLL